MIINTSLAIGALLLRSSGCVLGKNSETIRPAREASLFHDKHPLGCLRQPHRGRS